MPSARNLYDAVFDKDAVSDLPAVVNPDETITYDQLQALIDAVRSKAEVEAGQTIAIVMPNSIEFIVSFLAICADGGAVAPLNPAYTAAEFKTALDDLGITKVWVSSDDLEQKLKEANSTLHINTITCDLEQREKALRKPTNQDNGVALYLSTSGTTGKPKAVPLKHSNLLRGARNVAETYNLDVKDRTYLVQVLFHIHGIVAAMLAPLMTSGSLAIPRGGSLDASQAWSDFSKHGCTWVTGTPSILQTLLAAPAPENLKIRFIRSCSSPLLPAVFNALCKRFATVVVEAYAMTEASHQMCSNRLDRYSSGTVGPESGGTKICIWDSGDRGCQLGAEGEVCVSGDNVMDGYMGVSNETNEKSFWHGSDERGNVARWFRTGDRGILSTDGERRLILTGRFSEIINRGGEKISPVEVDEAIMVASDEIREAACFAVEDEFYGQEVEAAVVIKDGSSLTQETVQQLLQKKLARFKIPKRIHFCDGKIPKGPTGKIQRKNLAHIFRDAGKSPNGTQESSTDKDLYDVIDRAVGLAPGTAAANTDKTLLQLGADSMALSKIASEVKKATGANLDTAQLFSFPRVSNVVDLAMEGKSGIDHVEDTIPRPEPFSLLQFDEDERMRVAQEAEVSSDDIEDMFPLSACQSSFRSAFLGESPNTDRVWMWTRYRIRQDVDPDRLHRALKSLQEHEESLRWVLARSEKTTNPWVTIQLRPGVEDRVKVLDFDSKQQADKHIQEMLSTCRHYPGLRTAQLYIITIGKEVQLAFNQSHIFTEGQAQSLILENLNKAFAGEPMEPYTPYSSFVKRAAADDQSRLDFWAAEGAAQLQSDGPHHSLKSLTLLTPPAFIEDDLQPLGVQNTVHAPLSKLSVRLKMTFPLMVEAVLPLTLALYFGQQDPTFSVGHTVYDRGVSVRTEDHTLSNVRAMTGAYHPNYISLDIARRSLWSYFHYFQAITQNRQQKTCLNYPDIARHSVAFTWRFHNDEAVEGSQNIIAGIEDEACGMRAFKMCYINANRAGSDGVTIAIGFHQQWVEERRRNGCKVELIDIYSSAVRFIAEQGDRLEQLSFEDLERAVCGNGVDSVEL